MYTYKKEKKLLKKHINNTGGSINLFYMCYILALIHVFMTPKIKQKKSYYG